MAPVTFICVGAMSEPQGILSKAALCARCARVILHLTHASRCSYVHTAWNNTEGGRYILLFDIIREEYAHLHGYICARVAADLILQ